MTFDLSPFAFRVKAARDTNQCLDYAEDVEALIGEVQRLQSGYEALMELYAVAYRRAAFGTGTSYEEMRQATYLEQGVKAAVEAFERGFH